MRRVESAAVAGRRARRRVWSARKALRNGLCLLGAMGFAAAGLLTLGMKEGPAVTPRGPAAIGWVQVRSGETVWEIARRYAPGDPRPLVDAIQRENGLFGRVLLAGETIRVPLD